jgi:NADPH:quinone reductase-like Zn-dependent oxidoreductase
MIVGAAGNVRGYAVQTVVNAGMEMLRKLGAGSVVDSTVPDFEKRLPQVDCILDTVGGATLDRCANALKYGGRLASVVSPQPLVQRKDTQAIFFYAEVSTARLRTLTTLFESGGISARVGSVLPLAEVRRAHEMLGGAPTCPARSYCKFPRQMRIHSDFGTGCRRKRNRDRRAVCSAVDG